MKKPFVAIVDDDSSFAAYLRTFLSLRGYEARCYTRGDELLASIKQNETPDVILLDVMMPGMDGWEVARVIKNHPDFGDTRVVMLTARSGFADKQEGLRSGADDYIVKPIRLDELAARVEKNLEARTSAS